MSTVTLTRLKAMKAHGEPIAMLTAYDAGFAYCAEQAGVDLLLVGDSLGTVVQGHATTVPVTLDHMVYHTALVARAAQRAMVLADLPFLSYATPEQAVASAARLMQEGGAHGVKLEGGRDVVAAVERLAAFGVPVCAHLGLLPQSVNKLGGYRVQGREADEARRLKEEALALEQAGADLLVLECVPAALASEITVALTIPVIGIGAGGGCDGQVLVVYDLLGITPGKRPSFAPDFLTGHSDGINGALRRWVDAVRQRTFPA